METESLTRELQSQGFSKDQISVALSSLKKIQAPDKIELYRTINSLFDAKNNLNEITSTLSNLKLPLALEKATKRTYTRKPAESTLIERSGVAAASEALLEQKPEVPEHLKRPFPKKRKRETEQEIKNNVGDLGQGVLNEEEKAANLTIDL